ncbi:MAG: YfiR family protein [Acidobacteria bacterium]|nr:YfiR family protein [Acidobacteriota bacterium]
MAVLLGTSGALAGAQETRASETEVKAALVYNFVKFVEWPADTLREGSDVAVCVNGNEQIATAISLIQGRKLNGHRLTVRRRKPDEDDSACHVMFMGDRQRWSPLLSRMRGLPVLTIGDGEEFVRRGGMIAFVLENDRVRFMMNPAAGERARLKISSRLLALARIVQEEKGF